MIAALALWGCTTTPTEPEAEPLSQLPATTALTRASLDLRGTRPSLADLEAVEADPGALDGLVDTYLQDEALEDRLLHVFQEQLHTRSENFQVVDVVTLDDPEKFLDAVGQEPLRLMARVAAEDLPWTDVLMADWTMANRQLADVYPVDYPQGEIGWHKVSWTDGRPTAGVLSTNGFFWRYPSTDSNKQRKRANQISRIFTCRDFLATEIPFDDDIDLLNEEAVDNAIKTNASCKGCHDDLDPIASYLWGYSYGFDDGFAIADAAIYHPERERRWQTETDTEPGWYGLRGETMTDLGHQIAADSRFVRCTVETTMETLLRRELDTDDRDAIDAHERAFIDGDLRFRALLKSILTDEMYASDEDDARMPSRKWMTPDLMASQIEGLTGFTWTAEDRELLFSENLGLLTLAGGLDGATVTAAADRPNTTVLLVQDRLAFAAATWTVTEELDRNDPRLFTRVNPDTTGTEQARREQIADLQGRLHSRLVSPQSPEVDAYVELFDDVLALDENPEAAWTAVLTAMFRDPDFAAY